MKYESDEGTSTPIKGEGEEDEAEEKQKSSQRVAGTPTGAVRKRKVSELVVFPTILHHSQRINATSWVLLPSQPINVILILISTQAEGVLNFSKRSSSE